VADPLDVLEGRARWCVVAERCETFAARLPDGCVDLLWLDPPYFRVVDEPWDKAWDSRAAFLAWLATCADEWRRVLAPNGSLYVCASPQLSAAVERIIAERFAVLNHVVWFKDNGWWRGTERAAQRQYFPATERILFAEQQGSDAIARGESRYVKACDDLRGFVFEPLRAYLDGERERAGVTRQEIEAATGTQMAGHWFSRVQWALPTEKHYRTLRELFGRKVAEPLRREYEDLRREYEDLRRPFALDKSSRFVTDLWTYPAVADYPGKHPCEKPREMLRDVVRASSRPDALVADFFGGSFVSGEAAVSLGRRFVGCDASPRHAAQGVNRITFATGDTTSPIRATGDDHGPLFAAEPDRQPSLFGEAADAR